MQGLYRITNLKSRLLTAELSTTAANVVGRYHQAMDKLEFSTLSEIWHWFPEQINTSTKTEAMESWRKDPEKAELDSVMVHLAESFAYRSHLIATNHDLNAETHL